MKLLTTSGHLPITSPGHTSGHPNQDTLLDTPSGYKQMELLSLLVWVQFCASLVEWVLLVVAEHLQQHGVVLEVERGGREMKMREKGGGGAEGKEGRRRGGPRGGGEGGRGEKERGAVQQRKEGGGAIEEGGDKGGEGREGDRVGSRV